MMGNTLLYSGLWKDAYNGIREIFQPINTGNRDVVNTLWGKTLNQKLDPSLLAIYIPNKSLQPSAVNPQNIIDCESDVAVLVVSNFVMNRIQSNDRIDRIERAAVLAL